MRVLLDTSVVVAGLLPAHPTHAVAAPWLARARTGGFEFVFSAHFLRVWPAGAARIVAPQFAGLP